LEPPHGVFFQGLQNRIFNGRRQVGKELTGKRRRLLDMLLHQVVITIAIERNAPRQHFIKRDPKGIDVSPDVQRLVSNLFRRHVVKRPQPNSRCCQTASPENLCNAEIHDFDDPAFVDHQIRGLDVPMDDPCVMSMGQARQRLLEQGKGALLGNRSDSPNHLAEGLPIHIFHHHAVTAFELEQSIKRGQVGMIELGLGSRLRQESLRELGVLRQLSMQQFQGDDASE
jgi:hypothetical protein